MVIARAPTSHRELVVASVGSSLANPNIPTARRAAVAPYSGIAGRCIRSPGYLEVPVAQRYISGVSKKKTAPTPNEYFATMAQPHSWFLVADNLHEQAVRLKESVESQLIYLEPGARPQRWDGNNRAVFLLAGFALENAIKAFLVYENPSWIANGRLDKKLRSHSLTNLAQRSTLIPYKKRGTPTLLAFEDGLDSWARYPCSLDAARTKPESQMPRFLWGRYLKLMGRYGIQLRRLLERRWKGPYNVSSSYYRIDKTWLG